MNIKNIILGIVAVLLLGGIIWYAGTGSSPQDQTGSIADQTKDQNTSASIEDFIIGDPNAPVTIEEFSSHFCGHCANFHQTTLPLIIDEYVKTGKVKIIPRLVSPLEVNLAVLCAQEQGEFQRYSEYLFEHASELEAVGDLKTIAGELGLAQDDFNQCFDNQKYQSKAESWFALASQKEVSGTPTFFINGEKVVGNQPYEVFQEKIEEKLGE